MDSIAYIAKLKPGMAERARQLIAEGPPFRPENLGFERHEVYLSPDYVVFVFKGGAPGLLMETIASQGGRELLGAWEEVIDGLPSSASPIYSWDRGSAEED